MSEMNNVLAYERLRAQCKRIMNVHPDDSATPIDCVGMLRQLNGYPHGIAAETLARALAEYVHEQKPTGA